MDAFVTYRTAHIPAQVLLAQGLELGAIPRFHERLIAQIAHVELVIRAEAASLQLVGYANFGGS